MEYGFRLSVVLVCHMPFHEFPTVCLICGISVPAKAGVEPSGCVELAKHVNQACPNLEFCGLMTIGMPDYTSTPENFKVMVQNSVPHRVSFFISHACYVF